MKKEKNKAIYALLYSLLLGAIIILPNMIINHGIFVLSADYNTQQVPFLETMNYSLKEGSFLWSWYNELGSNFIGTYSFYNLLSPYSIISYLFKARWYPYISGYLIILKFGISGLSSYLFLKRYTKNPKYAIMGSLLYAFSGYQLNNILFHFYDSVSLFPLALYTLDNLMYDKKKNAFSITIAILALTNWFMFIGECVFIIIYTAVKIICKEYKWDLKAILYFIFEFSLGILLSSIILIPSLLFTISNPRIDGSWNILKMIKYSNSGRYFEIFRSLFFPSETMQQRAFLTNSNYDSVEFYLPFVGSIIMISSVLKHTKKWDKILMIILLIFMFIPILNSSFFACRINYYARWFYMVTLIASLVSIKGIEDNIKISPGIIISLSSLIISIMYYMIITIRHPEENFIFDKNHIIITILVMIINIILTYIIFKLKNKTRDKLLFIFISLFIIIWGNYTIVKYSETGIKENISYKNYLNSYKIITTNEYARTNSTESCNYNISNIIKNLNIKTFNTNINGSSFKFQESIGNQRYVQTTIDVNSILNNFLSVKYIISCKETLKGYKLLEDNIYKIYQNPNFIEMGIVLNKYISNEEYNLLPSELKQKTLLNKIVLNKNQIKEYNELENKNQKIITNKFEYTNNGFTSEIELSDDALILYTVPYDKGWSATVNNKKTKIEYVDNGFMAIKGLKGKNKIKFSYMPPGLKIGTSISAISLITYITNIIYEKRFKNKRCSRKKHVI